MEFFKRITEIGLTNIDIKIVVKDNIVSVLVDPKSVARDKVLQTIQPASLSGTAEELDAEFFNLITEALKRTAGVISNIEDHEKSVDAANKKKEEEKKSSADKKTKKSDAGSEVISKTESKTPVESKVKAEPKPKVEKPAKPQPEYKFKKYEDALKQLVNVPGFKIKSSNIAELKEKVSFLTVMDKENKLGIEWEKKIKDWKPSIFDDDEDEIAEQIVNDDKSQLDTPVPETNNSNKQSEIAPPPPPEDDDDENPFDDEPDTDFEDFNNDGGTGHGDISYSDADNGL